MISNTSYFFQRSVISGIRFNEICALLMKKSRKDVKKCLKKSIQNLQKFMFSSNNKNDKRKLISKRHLAWENLWNFVSHESIPEIFQVQIIKFSSHPFSHKTYLIMSKCQKTNSSFHVELNVTWSDRWRAQFLKLNFSNSFCSRVGLVSFDPAKVNSEV